MAASGGWFEDCCWSCLLLDSPQFGCSWYRRVIFGASVPPSTDCGPCGPSDCTRAVHVSVLQRLSVPWKEKERKKCLSTCQQRIAFNHQSSIRTSQSLWLSRLVWNRIQDFLATSAKFILLQACNGSKKVKLSTFELQSTKMDSRWADTTDEEDAGLDARGPVEPSADAVTPQEVSDIGCLIFRMSWYYRE